MYLILFECPSERDTSYSGLTASITYYEGLKKRQVWVTDTVDDETFFVRYKNVNKMRDCFGFFNCSKFLMR